MKIRSIYLNLAVVAACAGFAQTADAQATYTMTEIGDPNAAYTSAGSINNRGEITAASMRLSTRMDRCGT